MKKILYLGPSGIGDWCFIYPSLAPLLKSQGAERIDVIIPYQNSGNEILTHNPQIGKVDYLQRRTKGIAIFPYFLRLLRLLFAIRKEHYEAIAVSYLSNQPDFLLLALLSGINKRIGRRTNHSWLQRHAISIPINDNGARHKVDIHHRYAHGQKNDQTIPLIDTTLLPHKNTLFSKYNFSQPYVALGIGGGRNASWRFWPAAKFRLLIEQCPEIEFILLGGGPDDQRQAEEICAPPTLGNVTNLVDRIGIEGAITILANADVVIGNDSGIANLACVMGTKTLCLYGPTNPTLTGPALLGATPIYIQVPCGPCFGDDQNHATAMACTDRRCLSEISINKVKTLLETEFSHKHNNLR